MYESLKKAITMFNLFVTEGMKTLSSFQCYSIAKVYKYLLNQITLFRIEIHYLLFYFHTLLVSVNDKQMCFEDDSLAIDVDKRI